jgi:hypothetical protein
MLSSTSYPRLRDEWLLVEYVCQCSTAPRMHWCPHMHGLGVTLGRSGAETSWMCYTSMLNTRDGALTEIVWQVLLLEASFLPSSDDVRPLQRENI